jgi:hypothetical protein
MKSFIYDFHNNFANQVEMSEFKLQPFQKYEKSGNSKSGKLDYKSILKFQ